MVFRQPHAMEIYRRRDPIAPSRVSAFVADYEIGEMVNGGSGNGSLLRFVSQIRFIQI